MRGRLQIKIDGQWYLGNRLAWLYVYGMWPVGIVDHEDRDPKNDRIANLRDVNHQQNAINTHRRAKFVGVHFCKGVWEARVGKSGKKIYAGSFKTVEEAARAYDAKALEIWEGQADLNFPEERLVTERKAGDRPSRCAVVTRSSEVQTSGS